MLKAILRVSLFGLLYRFVLGLINDVIPFYRPGKDITCKANVALTGQRLCAIVGNRTSGPGLAASDDAGVYLVGAPTAGGRTFGVVGQDVPSGAVVAIKRNGILPVLTSAIFTAEQEAKVAADGTILPATTGTVVVGVVHTGVGSGAVAELDFFTSQYVKP